MPFYVTIFDFFQYLSLPQHQRYFHSSRNTQFLFQESETFVGIGDSYVQDRLLSHNIRFSEVFWLISFLIFQDQQNLVSFGANKQLCFRQKNWVFLVDNSNTRFKKAKRAKLTVFLFVWILLVNHTFWYYPKLSLYEHFVCCMNACREDFLKT